MVVSNNYSSCDDKSVQMKPVRVLLQDILRKSHIEVTPVDMVPETIVENCDIKSHMHTHTDEKPCSCSQGNESFEHSSQQSNNEHSETHKELGLGRTHNKETPFTCILCSKSFATKSNLTRHMRTHTGEKSFSCMICNKLFSEGSEVNSHMCTHTGEKLYSCSHCNKSYAHRYSLKMHMMSHTSEEPYSDMKKGSKALPQHTARHDTSLGITEMVDKQRRHDNCKFETKQLYG